MFKPKTTISGRLENSSGGAIRTHDLQVMSLTSCLCSTPHRFPTEQDYTLRPGMRQPQIRVSPNLTL